MCPSYPVYWKGGRHTHNGQKKQNRDKNQYGTREANFLLKINVILPPRTFYLAENYIVIFLSAPCLLLMDLMLWVSFIPLDDFWLGKNGNCLVYFVPRTKLTNGRHVGQLTKVTLAQPAAVSR
jgi:hypothetical protein